MWVVRRSNKDYCQTTWSGEGEHGGATGQAVWSAASEEEEITGGVEEETLRSNSPWIDPHVREMRV
jgi:hypothetical protein